MATQIIENIVRNSKAYKTLKNNLLSSPQIHMKGLAGSLKSIFLSSFYKEKNYSLLVVLPDREKSELLADALSDDLGEVVAAFFPGGEPEIEEHVSLNPRKMGQQMQVLRGLFFDEIKIVCTTPDGLALRLPSPKYLRDRFVLLAPKKNHPLHTLIERLSDFGYVRESMVEKPGELSVRGGILDIFPFTGEMPHRIEFFGDEIESIREFDIQTQISTHPVRSLLIVPTSAVWLERTDSILSYLPDDAILFLEDPDLILAEIEKRNQQGDKSQFYSVEIEKIYLQQQILFHHTIYSKPDLLNFGGKGIRQLGRSPREIRKGLISLCSKRERVLLLCESKGQSERIRDVLDLIDHPLSHLEILERNLLEGFDLPSSGLTVYTERELFGRLSRRRKKERFREGVPIRELSEIKTGDFVVHIDYGIGVYQGLEKITVNEVSRECLSLLYKDGDKLYVPVDKIERVQKYAGKEGANPELSKLGTKRWEQIKKKTKQSIKNIAKDLIALYAERKNISGFSFSPDTVWQKELEATFAYEETPDQANAIIEVKQDLEKPVPMDRLVCGDVGFGKTEVVLRAAFKVINDGKQVAILVPTTILAQQHFRTFQERLNRFPVTVELLSRFRTKKEQESVVQNLKNGSVDIVIGTHRLLSKDVGFKDLGLLVIDEEHRFGVRHKEKLKSYRKNVDVLTLSATPIPRTLHLSLSGLRDMSLINTPPRDRLPIITEVSSFNEYVIVDAILKEIARGGQVFFVHNRVRSIHAMARMIKRLIPEAKVAVAHGQMHERELEKVMVDFINKKYDCLVSTMIIESGLDMPNVNTLIVHRADRFGLAQLYQLRGRVGRSEKRAYAFLLTPPFQNLTQEAIKRIRTIEEFTELGSGFQIAMRDMEIRGVGNMLGVEQSGYMDAVGFDLYNQLIQESIQEVQMENEPGSKKEELRTACVIDADVSAYFPENYVPDESMRVNLYRRLSMFQNFSEVDRFSEELRDRFGPLPEEVTQLLEINQIRMLGSQKGLNRIVLEEDALTFYFDESWVQQFQNTEQLSQKLHSITNGLSVPARFGQKRGLSLELFIPSNGRLVFIKKMLQSWD